jgi:hypothetical protein
MAPIRQIYAAAALGLLGGQIALAAMPLQVRDLAMDLSYGIYQGVHDPNTQLNIWKGYDIGQGLEHRSAAR